MSDIESALIVGGDSLVGGAIAAHLEAKGVTVFRTTRRPGALDAGVLRLDLAAEPESWPALPRVDGAVLAAAVARLGACAADAEGSARVNVDGTCALAERLAAAGSHVVFLSSDKVFDGATPRRRRDDETCPRTEYGRQKATAERAILGLGAGTAVLRLAKVLSPALALLEDWRRALAAGRPIAPYHDMYLAPVTDRFVAELATRILAERRRGVFHASGDEDIPYVELGAAVARALGAPAALVRPAATDGRALPPETRPPHGTLDMALEERLWGLGPPSSRAVCADVAATLARVL